MHAGEGPSSGRPSVSPTVYARQHPAGPPRVAPDPSRDTQRPRGLDRDLDSGDHFARERVTAAPDSEHGRYSEEAQTLIYLIDCKTAEDGAGESRRMCSPAPTLISIQLHCCNTTSSTNLSSSSGESNREVQSRGDCAAQLLLTLESDPNYTTNVEKKLTCAFNTWIPDTIAADAVQQTPLQPKLLQKTPLQSLLLQKTPLQHILLQQTPLQQILLEKTQIAADTIAAYSIVANNAGKLVRFSVLKMDKYNHKIRSYQLSGWRQGNCEEQE
ncbi:hypothetical protein STEG23_004473, partial [Scotinomys teguina]